MNLLCSMFSTRFWSSGYNDGLNQLYAKLNQGIIENGELLAVAQARADVEEAHGARLRAVASSLAPKKSGFGRDDGATMRKAYEGILTQMAEEGRHHSHIADSIRSMVIDPYTTWTNQHKQRVEISRTELKRLVKAYEHDLDAVHRAQQRYFNRCRLEEDQVDRELDSNSVDQQASRRVSGQEDSNVSRSNSEDVGRRVSTSGSSVSDQITEQTSQLSTSEELVLVDKHYTADESQRLISRMLSEIPKQPTKIAILGTYEHTSSGAAITDWLRANTEADSTDKIENAGQQLVNHGLLRLIGQVGSRFVNSSQFMYQWRPSAWEFAGLSMATTDAASSGAQLLYNDLAKRWTTRADPSTHSVKELDQKYRKSVAILDNARTDLDATMFEHLNYLERCERERLVAFKAVILDFSAAVSNIVPALSASVDQMLLFHETADVDRDLRFFVENYQTGRYNPDILVYDNYYSSVDGATVYGLDLDLRARADKKRVPLIVGTILSTLDSAYPQMENDGERLAIWQTPIYVQLRAAQEARQAINDSADSPGQVRSALGERPALVVVQALKLYFLELPNSLIGSQLYDILKGIYSKFGGDSEEQSQARLQSLENTLAQLTLTHVATLDAFTAHIHRLVTIANAEPADIEHIAKEWGPALCWPKVRSALSLDDVFPVQLFKDLLNSRDRIFGELKKHAIVSPQASVSSNGPRFRSISQTSRASSMKLQQARSPSPASVMSVPPSVPIPPSSYIPSTLSNEMPHSPKSVDEEHSFADAEENI